MRSLLTCPLLLLLQLDILLYFVGLTFLAQLLCLHPEPLLLLVFPDNLHCSLPLICLASLLSHLLGFNLIDELLRLSTSISHLTCCISLLFHLCILEHLVSHLFVPQHLLFLLFGLESFKLHLMLSLSKEFLVKVLLLLVQLVTTVLSVLDLAVKDTLYLVHFLPVVCLLLPLLVFMQYLLVLLDFAPFIVAQVVWQVLHGQVFASNYLDL